MRLLNVLSAQFAVIFRSPFYSIRPVNRSSQNSRDIVLAKGRILRTSLTLHRDLVPGGKGQNGMSVASTSLYNI